MGVNVETKQRPPLPAPTEPTDVDTDVATDLSRRTDQTSYSIPEDGSPVTISTHKLTSKDTSRLRHGRNKSQTSLLIEYFEATKGDKGKSRPSVRVKVTPSSQRKSKTSSDSVQITGIGRDKKPSYTRRISLGNKSSNKSASIEGTEGSHSSGSNLSNQPPVEVEILNHSDLSSTHPSTHSRDLHFQPTPSDISSMPPDSLLDPSHLTTTSNAMSDEPSQSQSPERKDAYLDLPKQDRARSASHERIKQKVMEKLLQRQRGEAVEYEPDTKPSKERRRRSSRTTREDDLASAAESTILSSSITPSNLSYASGTSKVSLTNPKLLQMVEDTVRRLILPEITQLKNEQRLSQTTYTDDELDRPASKHSGSPTVSSKPKVVLNRYEDEPGEILSRGDSERREKSRRSSRGESGSSHRERRSSRTSTRDESVRSKSSRDKDGGGTKSAVAAGLAGGVLTAAALRHHDSQENISRERRKKRRSRDSRSGSTSVAETEQTYRKEDIPPMPWTGPSAVNDSELTRPSILSAATESSPSASLAEPSTPIKEVSRGSLGGSLSPASTTPRAARSPRTLDSRQSRKTPTEERPGTSQSVHSISTKAKMAALAAAGLGIDTLHASPVLNSSVIRDSPSDPLIPSGLRPRSRVSELSAGFEERQRSAMSPLSSPSSPTTHRKSFGLGYDDTENQHDLEEWFQQEHEKNEEYRKSLAGSSTLSDAADDHRFSQYTDGAYQSSDLTTAQDVQGVGATPRYIQAPHDVESAVASLIDPSMVSASILSSQDSTHRPEEGHHPAQIDESVRKEMNNDSPRQENAEDESPSQNRWSAIREQAMALSSGSSPQKSTSPQRSEPKSDTRNLGRMQSPPVEFSATGIPDVNDPMPEIGHGIDTESDLSTNPPEIQGPGTGDARFRFLPSTSQSPGREERHDSISEHSYGVTKKAIVGAEIAAGAFAADRVAYNKSAEKHTSSPGSYASRETTPDVRQAQVVHLGRAENTSPIPHFGDEGYVSAAYARSPGGATTPKLDKQYNHIEMADYNEVSAAEHGKHMRHLSGNSHGMSSPLYDSSTGRGIDTIQSKDVVALMDHLTVRDAQRNARDTEILVTLVRSAAEMRQNFEEMKKYIAEQDRKIMEHTDRDAEYTVQKVLGGPRPPPPTTPRATHAAYTGEELPTKRKNVFKRALKGLSKRGSNDLSKIEDMLNQLLGDVEDLRQTQGSEKPPMSLRGSSFDSYEDRPRYGHDSGYEPEGQAGTSSTPNQSGLLSNQSGNLSVHSPKENLASPQEKWFHSGYNGRRDSINRVSTVMEEDSNDGKSILGQHEAHVLDNQFENNERLLTPTQERYNRISPSTSSTATPPQQRHQSPYASYSPEATPDKQSKHGSTLSGVPKTSRWSKTTSSSTPEIHNEPDKRRSQYSNASKSKDSSASIEVGYYENGYALQSDDRLRSTQSLAKETAVKDPQLETRSIRSARSELTRTPSPLIPSETSSSLSDLPVISPTNELNDYDDLADFDDPKYSAHRDSLLLQHPQPRPGPTHRHQTNLENEARTFSGPEHFEGLTNSDLSQRSVESDFDPLQWGSNPSLSLARTNKLSGLKPAKDDGPLVPQNKATPAPKVQVEPTRDQRPQSSQRPLYYSTPLGSGHLLEPIEEVRYSLETDRGHRSPAPSASPRVANIQSPARKITGPRPMGSSRTASGAKDEQPQQDQRTGTVRRKPVPLVGRN